MANEKSTNVAGARPEGATATRARRTLSTPARYVINTILVVAFLVVGDLMVSGGAISRYQGFVLQQVGIYIIMAVSLNIATGYLGQLPLGHAGFMSIGGYSCAIFIIRVSEAIGVTSQDFINGTPVCGLLFVVGVVFGGLCAALSGLVIGIPALRLKGDYLAIITLGFAEVFAVVAISLFLIHTMMKSRHGRAILAIRDNEIAAEATGVNTTYYKTFAFVVSAFFAGVAGALYAGCIGVMAPARFGFMKSIEILVMVVLGGMGSMLGSVVSATVLTILPEALRAFADYRMIAYAVVLILTMIFRPQGLMGRYDFSLGNVIEHLMNGELPWARRKADKEADANA